MNESIMKFNPAEDGITHLNVYSKARTDLGRFLSNFTAHPISTEDGPFVSVEGYWYWLKISSSSPDREILRTLAGYSAKKLGRSLPLAENSLLEEADFKRKIVSAIKIKILSSDFLNSFRSNILPLTHYYVFNGKVIEAKEGQWILQFLNDFQQQLNNS